MTSTTWPGASASTKHRPWWGGSHATPRRSAEADCSAAPQCRADRTRRPVVQAGHRVEAVG